MNLCIFINFIIIFFIFTLHLLSPSIFSEEINFDTLFEEEKKNSTQDSKKHINLSIDDDEIYKAKRVTKSMDNPLTLLGFAGKELFGIGSVIEPDPEIAKGYCYEIKEKDSKYGCLSGVALVQNKINLAQSYCYDMNDNDSKYGCLSGAALVQNKINLAQNYCYDMNDNDSKTCCLSGIALAQDKIYGAKYYCYDIRDEDSKNGCLSGLASTEGDNNTAEYYCNSIINKDSKYGCYADVILSKYIDQKTFDIENEELEKIEKNNEKIRKINEKIKLMELFEDLTNLENENSDVNEKLEKILDNIIKILKNNPQLNKDPEVESINALLSSNFGFSWHEICLVA